MVDPADKKRAGKLLAETETAITGGDYAKAIANLQKIVSIKGDFEEKKTATARLQEVDEKAQAAFKDASKQSPVRALQRIKELQQKYAGSNASREASGKAAELEKDPAVAAAVRDARYEKEASVHLKRGQDAVARKNFSAALLAFDKAVREFSTTPSGKQAKAEADKIRSDKALMAKLDTRKKGKRAQSLLRMAKSYLQNNAREMAKEKLQQIVSEFGGTAEANWKREQSQGEATQAKEMLKKI